MCVGPIDIFRAEILHGASLGFPIHQWSADLSLFTQRFHIVSRHLLRISPASKRRYLPALFPIESLDLCHALKRCFVADLARAFSGLHKSELDLPAEGNKQFARESDRLNRTQRVSATFGFDVLRHQFINRERFLRLTKHRRHKKTGTTEKKKEP